MRAVCRMLGLAVATIAVAAGFLARAAAPACAMPPVIAPAPVPYVVTGFDPVPLTGPKVGMTLFPAVPDGYFGWYVSVPHISLSAERPALIRYVWDDPDGGTWLPYAGPLIGPEGKHVLYAQADEGGAKGPLTAIEVKVDLRSHAAVPLAAMQTTTLRTGIVTMRATVNPWAGPRVVRVYGENRYETAAEIAKTDFGTAQTAIVARGDNFPDALASAGLAGIYGAPIVLVYPTAIPQATADVLKSLGVSHAIIVGDTRSVSAGVESTLKRTMKVERLGGVDRYATAALIAEAIVDRGGQQGKAFVARGDLYPDSLSVSPYAYRAKRPIILVKPTAVPDVSARAFGDLRVHGTVIAGSDKAVSDDVRDQIAGLTGTMPQRLAGIDRYDTGILAARYGVVSGLGDFHFVGIATGQNFPDALCGGAAVGAKGGVILMTPKAYLYPGVASELASNGPSLRDIQVYGSEAAVSKAAWDGILDAIR